MKYEYSQEPKEFIVGKTFLDGVKYNYGFFYSEKQNKFFLSDRTIHDIVKNIPWKLDNYEKNYLTTWIKCEKVHRDYALGVIDEKEYESRISKLIDEYERLNNCDFGQCCDKLINYLIETLEA